MFALGQKQLETILATQETLTDFHGNEAKVQNGRLKITEIFKIVKKCCLKVCQLFATNSNISRYLVQDAKHYLKNWKKPR